MAMTYSQHIEVITSDQGERTVSILPQQKKDYLLILKDHTIVDLVFHVQTHAQLNLKVLCLGQAHTKIEANIVVRLEQDFAQANITMLSLLQDHSNVTAHGSIVLEKNIQQVSGHLLEENLILGKHIRLRTAPILDVHSSDVQASHGCRVQRLDPKRLFYMQSRGLSAQGAQGLIVEGYLNSIFEGFEQQDDLLDSIKVLLAG